MDIHTLLQQERQAIIRDKLMSDEFLDFANKNLSPFGTLMTYYNCALMEVETKFRVLDEEYRLQHERDPIESIQTRIKSMDSLMRKIHRRNIPLTVEDIEENINDIAGVRVVCSFLDDVYRLADCLLQQDDVTLIKIKDYIKHPKESGYRSLHIIVAVPIFLRSEKRSVKVEVQIRTLAMDNWAALDHKLRYKKNLGEEELKSLELELTECAEISAALDRRMQNIRDRYWDDEEAAPAGAPAPAEKRPHGLLQAARERLQEVLPNGIQK